MKVAWLFLLVLLLALAAAIGLRWGFDRALEKRDVRAQLSRATANLFGCDAGFAPLKWHGLTTTSGGFAVRCSDAAFEIQGRSVHLPVRLAQLWRNQWQIDQLEATHLQIVFGGPASSQNDSARIPAFFAPAANGPRLKEIHSADTDLISKLGAVRGSRAKVSAGQIEAQGGALMVADFPSAQVKQLQMQYGKSSVSVKQAAFTFGNDSALLATGNLEPNVDVDLSLSRAPIAKFLGPFVEGEFDAHGHLHGMPGGSWQAAGAMTLERALINNIDALRRAAHLIARPELAQFTIDHASADFDFEGGTLTVKNLALEAKGLLALRGELSMRGERIDGEFEFGVAPDIADKFPGAREQIFQRATGDYLWTNVSVSGKRGNLRDNLRPRLVRAAREQHADEKFIDALEDL